MSGGISKANLSPGDNRVVMSEAAAADAGETRPRQTPTLLCVRLVPVSQSTQSNLEDLQQDGGQRTYSDIPIINSVICIARVHAIGNSVMLYAAVYTTYSLISDMLFPSSHFLI